MELLQLYDGFGSRRSAYDASRLAGRCTPTRRGSARVNHRRLTFAIDPLRSLFLLAGGAGAVELGLRPVCEVGRVVDVLTGPAQRGTAPPHPPPRERSRSHRPRRRPPVGVGRDRRRPSESRSRGGRSTPSRTSPAEFVATVHRRLLLAMQSPEKPCTRWACADELPGTVQGIESR